MIYGLIIAAGKQSRFTDSRPKALSTIGNTCLLDINVHNMLKVCDQVWVICSHENVDHFVVPASKLGAYVLDIDSGYGSGDAILKALCSLNLSKTDRVFIQWGDCISHDNIHQYLYTICDSYSVDRGAIIPCVYEQTPYVRLAPKGKGITVHFSKYGDMVKPGYHDISIFYANAYILRKYLSEFAAKIADTASPTHYKHKHGNEMEFLDLFNETRIPVELMVLDNYVDLSFNTVDELNNLNKLDLEELYGDA